MKWTNKFKLIRRADWPVVSAPPMERVKEAHAWCAAQESTGYFYHHFTNTRWWFEHEQDAILFALAFGDKQ